MPPIGQTHDRALTRRLGIGRPLLRSKPGQRPATVVAAGLWSVTLAGIAVVWGTTGGYPFGATDPSAIISPLGGVPAPIGTAGAYVVAVIGTGTATAILSESTGARASGLTAIAWAIAAVLLLGVLDYRLLVIVAYAPLVVVSLPFGFLPVSDFLAAFTPAVVAQVCALVGGLAWSAVALGRTTPLRSRASAARWGRRATVVAIAVPLVYAATRWAWALGIPLGLNDELFRFGQQTGLWVIGAGLATLALAGAAVTSGLTMGWGERWPGWMPAIGARPIPVALAVVPALIVATLVTAAGLMFVRLTVTGTFDEAFTPLRGIQGSWAALGPELLWPAWGPALAIAALAYARRRALDDREELD